MSRSFNSSLLYHLHEFVVKFALYLNIEKSLQNYYGIQKQYHVKFKYAQESYKWYNAQPVAIIRSVSSSM